MGAGGGGGKVRWKGGKFGWWAGGGRVGWQGKLGWGLEKREGERFSLGGGLRKVAVQGSCWTEGGEVEGYAWVRGAEEGR